MRKKLLSAMMAIAMMVNPLMLSSFTTTVNAEGETDWTSAITYDSAAKIYTVHNADGLRWISGVTNETVVSDTYANDPELPEQSTFDGYHVSLDQNIDLSGTAWTPIHEFAGIFDGTGHKVGQMQVTVPNKISRFLYAGFFDSLDGTIRNLTVEGSVTVSTDNSSESISAGGICGELNGYYNSPVIENCASHVIVQITVKSDSLSSVKVKAGGLVGKLYESAALAFNCISTGAVSVTGTTTGAVAQGTLIGSNLNSTVTNCYAAKVDGTEVIDETSDSSTLSSVGTYDSNGNLAAANGTTLAFNGNLYNALTKGIMQKAEVADYYNAWSNSAVPQLTTELLKHTHAPWTWAQDSNGDITRSCTECDAAEVAAASLIDANGTQIGYFANIMNAVNEAKEYRNSTIRLLRDIPKNNWHYIVGGTFTIDFAGQQLSNALMLIDGGNVTYKDSENSNSSITLAALNIYSGKAIIENGSYQKSGALPVDPDIVAGGELDITGGTFPSGIKSSENPGKIKLYGGRFHQIETDNYNSINSIKNMLADGYVYRDAATNNIISNSKQFCG